MIKLLRRFVVVAGLMFWQGGFTFYSAVVVPTGAEVLGSHLNQGFVTQQVTNYINLAGVVACTILAWDIAAAADPARWRRRMRWGLWGIGVATLAALAWLHARLDAGLDPEQMDIVDRHVFRAEHQQYLIVSTIQWAAELGLLAGTLWAWNAEDSAPR